MQCAASSTTAVSGCLSRELPPAPQKLPAAHLGAAPGPGGRPGGPTTVSANGPGVWGNNILVWVKQASAAQYAKTGTPAASWFRLQVAYFRLGTQSPIDPTDPTKLADPTRIEPDAFEDFDNLSADP